MGKLRKQEHGLNSLKRIRVLLWFCDIYSKILLLKVAAPHAVRRTPKESVVPSAKWDF